MNLLSSYLVVGFSSQSVRMCLYLCFSYDGPVAVCESTATDSAVLNQSSTIEEQTATPSSHCPPPICKLAAIYLIYLSALSFVAWPFLTKTILQSYRKALHKYILKTWPHHFQTYCTNLSLPSCAAIYGHPDLIADYSPILSSVTIIRNRVSGNHCLIFVQNNVTSYLHALTSFLIMNSFTGLMVPACSWSSAGGC